MARDTRTQLRNMMMYQVFIRNHTPEGTFAAAEKDLPRIRELGADIVYLLPVHPIGRKDRKGELGSPYSICDYRSINPEYGTLDDFKHFVDAVHAEGMKCIIDVVYNHTSRDSIMSLEHPEWFYKDENGCFGNRVGDWTDIMDLDYSAKELWDYQIETLKYWAGIVDGFRCDVAPLVPIEFWMAARQEVKTVNEDCIWLSESIEPEFLLNMRRRGITAHSDAEIFQAFDISYDYDIYPSFTAYLTGKRPLSEYIDDIKRQDYIYPGNYVKLHFLENHDQTRAHFLIPDEKALRSFTALSFFLKGTAFVYAGQEYGASHLPSLFDKDTVSLKPEEGIDLCGLIRTLSQIKKDPLFARGSFDITCDKNDVVTASYECGEKIAAGVFPLAGKTSNAYVPLRDGVYTDLLSRKEYEVFRNRINTDGEPIILMP